MGAWGHALFQSDQDLDIVSELSHEAGLTKLEEEAAEKAGKDKEEQTAIYYTIYGGGSDPALVRDHLNSGVLAEMLAKYETKLLDGETEFCRDPGYIFMLLGACAMSLGCPLPKPYKTTMQKVYMCVGLPSDAIKQMSKALNSKLNEGYEDGKPYDFNSPGLIETANQSMEEAEPNDGGYHGLNVWGPGTLFYKPPIGSKKGLEDLRAARANEKKYGPDVCGGCGASEGEGGSALLSCGICKIRKYCGKDCQRFQWKFHQEVCKASKKEGLA